MYIVYGVRFLLILNIIYLGCTKQWLSMLIVLSTLVLSYVPDLLKRFINIHLTRFMNYLFIAFIILSQWCGTYLRAYDFISWWDIFLHGLSALLVGLGGLIVLKLYDREFILFQHKKYALISMIIFLFISASAVFWEIFEFLGDLFFGTNAQLGSLQDTMEDMLICVVVGIIFSVGIYISLRREKNNFITRQVNEFIKLNKE